MRHTWGCEVLQDEMGQAKHRKSALSHCTRLICAVLICCDCPLLPALLKRKPALHVGSLVGGMQVEGKWDNLLVRRKDLAYLTEANPSLRHIREQARDQEGQHLQCPKGYGIGGWTAAPSWWSQLPCSKRVSGCLMTFLCWAPKGQGRNTSGHSDRCQWGPDG